MKKLLKFSLVLAVVLTTATTFAAPPDFSLFVKKVEGKTIHFSMNTLENMELSLYDSNDVLIHTENLSTGNISRTYDLNSLPDGTYFLEADSTVKTARYEITVSDKVANLSKKAVYEVYKPTLVNNKGLVTLSVLNFNESPIAVRIYDNDGIELYEGKFDSKVSFFKKFDISSIPATGCVFEISYADKIFTQTVATK